MIDSTQAIHSGTGASAGANEKLLKKYFELFILIPFFVMWLFFAFVKKLPVVIPSFSNTSIYFLQYIFPLLIAYGFQFLILLIYALIRRRPLGLTFKELLVSLLYIPFIGMVLFLHFNFKSWAPLINPNTYDSLYNSIDRLTPIAGWLSSLGKTLDIGNHFSALYFYLFFAMFAASFTFHAVFDCFHNFRKVVVGTCLILLIGGVLYCVMPAVGPFIFQDSRLAGFAGGQQAMYEKYLNVARTGIIPAGYFGAAPGAMPSLHVANSLYFLLSAKRSLRWLAVIYLPIFIFIVIVAVASRYHYVIDLVFGALLSLLVLWIVDKVFGKSPAKA